MRVAVFSDIHGNYQALDAILKDINKNNIDMTIFLGDAVALGPDSTLCLKLLNKSNVIQLLGNHEIYCTNGIDSDPYITEENKDHQKYIDKLSIVPNLESNSLKCEFIFCDKKFTFFHYFLCNGNYPFMDLNFFKNYSYKEILNTMNTDYVFYGHEHKIEFHEVDGKRFYGVGSSGCVKGSKTYYHIIDINNEKVKVTKKDIKFDRKKFINSINNKNYPQKEKIASKIFGIARYKLLEKNIVKDNTKVHTK